MTDQELNMWERQDDVLKVLVSKEFGEWLYRRDKNKQKKGKWIKDECGSVICSECKAYRRDNRINHIRFCNACGARMEVSE